MVERQLPRGEPLPTLVRLFLLAVPVPEEEAAAALGTPSVARCVALGVATVANGRVEASVRLLPTRDVVVVCDRQHDFSAHLDAKHVMSVTPSTDLAACASDGGRARRPERSASTCTGHRTAAGPPAHRSRARNRAP